MSDEGILQELAQVKAELEQVKADRDRYGNYCGVAYQPDGVVRIGLEGAAAQTEVEAMRHEVRSVIGFLAGNNPFAAPAAAPHG